MSCVVPCVDDTKVPHSSGSGINLNKSRVRAGKKKRKACSLGEKKQMLDFVDEKTTMRKISELTAESARGSYDESIWSFMRCH